VRGDDGLWKIRKAEIYKDDDGKTFAYPPPNANIQQFIDQEILSSRQARGGYDDSLPSWVRTISRAQIESTETIPPCDATPPKRQVSNKKRKVTVTPLTNSSLRPPSRRRKSAESFELEDMRDQVKELQARLNSALQHIEGLEATVSNHKDEVVRIKIERDHLHAMNSELREKIELVQREKRLLTYDELRDGGILSNFAKDFTFFPNIACNDAFLDLINYTEGCEPGNGLCENLVRYDKVTLAARKEHNNVSENDDALADEANGEGDLHDIDGSELDGNSDESTRDNETVGTQRGRRRKLDWKTEWLVYCCYVGVTYQ